MQLIAKPVEWLLCHPARAANDARRDAEYDRIDAISDQRRSEWERRNAKLKTLFEGLPESDRDWHVYNERQSAEYDVWMQERSEEDQWRTEAHEKRYEESRRLSRKSDRILLWFIGGIVIASCVQGVALTIWR